MKRIVNLTTFVLFLSILFVPLLKTNFSGGGISVVENRTLAPKPTEFNLSDKSRIEVENWINDHIGGREKALLLKQKFEYEMFEIVPNNIVGKDGWLFSSFLASAHINNNPPSEQQSLRVCEKAAEVTEKYYLEGRTLILSSFPWKGWIYGEYMPDTLKRVHETSQFELDNEFLANDSRLNYVSVYETLLEEKKSQLVYCKAKDASHWNNVGSFIAYSLIMQKAASFSLDLRILTNEDFVISDKIYDTNFPCGFEASEADKEYVLKRSQAKSEKGLLKQIDFEGSDMWGASNAYINENRNLPKAVIVGDSYTWMFTLGWFAECFSEVYFMNLEDAARLDEVVQKVNPEFVFMLGVDTNISDMILAQ